MADFQSKYIWDDTIWPSDAPMCRVPRSIFLQSEPETFASFLARTTPGPVGVNDCGAVDQGLSADEELLAAVSYGEASVLDVFEEMAAIASVIVRQRDARNTTLKALLSSSSTFAFAASDGNPRVEAFRKAKPAVRCARPGMMRAIKAAKNALGKGMDYSNGAYFWDGVDIKTNYKAHPKVRAGVHITKAEHNVVGIEDFAVDVTTYWKVLKDGKMVDGGKRGHYTYTYESTAGFGKTIFWKYGDDFLKATGNSLHR
jgi:hypothetical protein